MGYRDWRAQDIAILGLKKKVAVKRSFAFSFTPPPVGQEVLFASYGPNNDFLEDPNFPSLRRGRFTITRVFEPTGRLAGRPIGRVAIASGEGVDGPLAHTVGGDSGGPWFQTVHRPGLFGRDKDIIFGVLTSSTDVAPHLEKIALFDSTWTQVSF